MKLQDIIDRLHVYAPNQTTGDLERALLSYLDGDPLPLIIHVNLSKVATEAACARPDRITALIQIFDLQGVTAEVAAQEAAKT